MCGIAGVAGDFSPQDAARITGAMTDALVHRGPDDRGIWTTQFGGATVSLGNTRLAIQDLSAAGHQPMLSPDGRYCVTFNGEIYNSPELRKILAGRAAPFRGTSDTETILRMFEVYSTDCFAMFEGMFALALADSVERRLYLVRDGMGIKPLYYHASGKRLYFASEVRALLAGGIPARIDPAEVHHFLSYGSVHASIVAGVNTAGAGEVLTVEFRDEAPECRSSCFDSTLGPRAPRQETDRNESTAHIGHLLDQSVKAQLIGDAPVGLFLSGGIDSTVLLDRMHRSGARARTFSIVFEDKDYSERDFAREAARRYDAEHHEIELSETDLRDSIPAALGAMDQPSMDGANTFVIARAVRAAGIKVALSGIGGDELFAGYPSHRRARLAMRVRSVRRPLRSAAATLGRRVFRGSPAGKMWDLLASDGSAESVYRISRRLFDAARIHELFAAKPPPAAVPEPAAADAVNEISRLEMTGYLRDVLLRDTDSMSMANSLEVRVPFLDRTLVRHVLSLPGDWKMRRSMNKPLLIEAMRGAIPESAWRRRKMGFALPFDRWMRASLRPQIEETFGDHALAQSIGVSPAAIEGVWRSFLGGSARWSEPWSLFALLKWSRRHRISL